MEQEPGLIALCGPGVGRNRRVVNSLLVRWLYITYFILFVSIMRWHGDFKAQEVKHGKETVSGEPHGLKTLTVAASC
jgi:hypothetical protein